MLSKKLIFILLACCCIFVAFAEKSTYGISFKSSAELINQRTSLILFEENPQKFKDSFTLSFDLSMRSVDRFGYILRIVNENNKEISLVFVNFRGENDLYLDFNSGITNKSIQIPVDKNDLTVKNWLHFKLDFDLKADLVNIFMQDKPYTCHQVGLTNSSQLKFVYGLYGINLDVPQMAIRNIQIEEQGKTKYIFPLNESEGEDVHDDKGKISGHVKNPVWIINHYHNWEKEITFKSECTAGIAYDEVNNRIIVINRDSIDFYYPGTNQKEHYKIPLLPFTVFSGEAIYNPKENSCYVYDLDPINTKTSSMAIINMDNFSVRLGNPETGNTLHHHNIFFGENQSDIYIFGGYGNFSYSNRLYQYNKDTDQWDTIALSGDSIHPRFFSAAGKGASPHEILIFGGFGNESGKQELGGRNLFDLFSVDLEKREVKKLWELYDPSTLFVPCGNLILDKEKTHFYTLCCPHHMAKTTTQLYKFNISNGSYEIVSSPISMLSEKINTTVYLFFNEEAQEFYTVIREFIDDRTSEVRIYSMLSPPVTQSELKLAYTSPSSFPWKWIAGFIIGIILLFIFYWIISRRRKNSESDIAFVETKEPVFDEQKKNAVFTLGDFTVFDNKGVDITYRFSSKLKSLFALILFNSVDDKNGISTERLTAELWPDKDTNSAKNIRGVTVNHLRNILVDMEGITLIHQNSRWIFTFDESFYCDYIRCCFIINQIEQHEQYNDNLNELLNLLKKGKLFPHLQEDWIDFYKSDLESKLEKILKQAILVLYNNKKYSRLVRLSEVYFVIDPLNEEILDISLKAFNKMKKTKQAEILYNRFVANYKESMGEEYKRS